MKLSIVLTFVLPCLHAAEYDDLLRFENGDQLHGGFEGISEGPLVLWNRDDVGNTVKFQTSDVRQVVLREGRPERALGELSYIGTSGGDRIPGRVREIDDERVVLETDFAGMLEIPRERVGLIAPNPLGGRILFHGPFDESAWLMTNREYPGGLPDPAEDEEAGEIPRWSFSGAAWYWQNKEMGTALVKPGGMPDRSIFKFEVAWKGRLSMAVGFHSNFSRPETEEEEAGEENQGGKRSSRRANLAEIFGDSYVLRLYSNYVMLYRVGFDEDGNPEMNRLQTTNSNVRLGDTGNATVEIRCSRETGEIVLFVNDEFVVQWSEPGNQDGLLDYAGKGDGFGFLVQADDTPTRISEVVVAEWNGMPDAARSLQVEGADIVLLANGTDRFSGKVVSIKDGSLKLESRYGDFEFPMEEVAEIRFAKSGLVGREKTADSGLKIRFHPLGTISGNPLSGDSGQIQLITPGIGEVQVNLKSATMLDFRDTESYFDIWDVEF